jgi:hypothetical protein
MAVDFVQMIIAHQQSTTKMRQRSAKQPSVIVPTVMVDTPSTLTCRNFEWASNVTDPSDLHLKKQDLHTTSTNARL